MVRTSNDLEHWIKFFLVGVAETARKSKATLERIIALRQKSEQKIMMTLGKGAKVGLELLKRSYSRPITDTRRIAEMLEISPPSAISLAVQFQEIEIFKEITGFSRNRRFVFSEYLNLFASTE